ncbi:MAG: hypothetical protein ABIR81_03610 [Ginsengibacter sp.]
MQKTIFLLLALSVIFSCSDKESASKSVFVDTSRSFFPVTEYILGQIHELYSTPVTPLKITTYKGNTDSIWMKPEQTKTFVQNFITPVIDSAKLHNMFKEKSFLDQSINAFTLTYDPIKKLADTFALRGWNIYIDADANKVKRIYIEKNFTQEDASYSQKLTWRSDHYCKIITVNKNDTSSQDIKEEQLIWNFDE